MWQLLASYVVTAAAVVAGVIFIISGMRWEMARWAMVRHRTELSGGKMQDFPLSFLMASMQTEEGIRQSARMNRAMLWTVGSFLAAVALVLLAHEIGPWG